MKLSRPGHQAIIFSGSLIAVVFWLFCCSWSSKPYRFSYGGILKLARILLNKSGSSEALFSPHSRSAMDSEYSVNQQYSSKCPERVYTLYKEGDFSEPPTGPLSHGEEEWDRMRTMPGGNFYPRLAPRKRPFCWPRKQLVGIAYWTCTWAFPGPFCYLLVVHRTRTLYGTTQPRAQQLFIAFENGWASFSSLLWTVGEDFLFLLFLFHFLLAWIKRNSCD